MRLFSVVALCFSLVGVAMAQQAAADTPATRGDVEKYLQVVHSRELAQKMMAAMSAPMHKMLHEQFLKDKDKLPPDFEAQMTKSMDDMLQQMPWDEIMQTMIPAYEKHFSKRDIQELTAFYAGPTGQKVLREMPAIMAEAMDAMMPIIRKEVDTMNSTMQQQIAEMIKHTPHNPATRGIAAPN